MIDEERRVLWEQYVEAYAHSQQTYDSSVRTLAAAGVAITVSLGTALGKLEDLGVVAAFLFLGSLLANLVSYWTGQQDMRGRLDALEARDDQGARDGNRWTKVTHVLNFAAGATLIVGGFFLARFVAAAT